MAKTLPVLVFATFITSGLALILSIVGLGTPGWLGAGVNLKSGVTSTANNRVGYGLFFGSYTRRVSTEFDYQLILTCDVGENKCAMLCGSSSSRSQYFQYLLKNQTDIDGYANCNGRSFSAGKSLNGSNILITEPREDEDVATTPDGFINCGVWISTIVLLCVAIIFGLAATVLSIINTVSNPVETVFSVTGLFAYNCVACVCSIITVILFGVHFGMVLKDNAAIFDTISFIGDSTGQGSLGYSFWLIVLSVLGYGASIGILIARRIIINREPDTIINLEDKNDNTIILF